jgi:HAD superfamily hydrolase (TIGR01549 family)
MEYKALLFDMEGVLLQGAETASWIYRAAASRALEDLDVHAEDDELAILGAFHYTQTMESVCEELGVSVAEFWKLREDHAAELENKQLGNGERKVFCDIEALEDLVPAHRFGIVSNNRQATVDQMVSVFNLDYINVAIGREHSLEGYNDRKPEPTMLLSALRVLGTDDAIYIGDSPKDIIAAKRAGIDSAFIRRSHNANLDLQEKPNIEIDGLEDLYECIAMG